MRAIFTKIILILCLLNYSIAIAEKNPSNTTATSLNKPTEQIYNEDKKNIFLTNEKHNEFSVQLKSNPTTGYSWFLREYNSELITPVKHQFIAPEKKLMGAPGYEVWTFKVNKNAFVVPMQTNIRLVYARPWQASDAATQINFRISTKV